MNRPSRLYLPVRRFVDRELARSFRPVSPSLGFFLLGSAILLEAKFRSPATMVLVVVMGLFALAWTAFVVWRYLRLMKAVALRSDRGFDQRGKFRLAPVYWLSESVTRAVARRRSEARRAKNAGRISSSSVSPVRD